MSDRSSDGPDDDAAQARVALRRGLKSALARWALAKQRGHRPVARPSPQDEATHQWDGQRRFAEDYTFAGVQAGLGLVVRLEWLPGRDSHRVWVMVLRPDGVWALPGGQLVLRSMGDDRWRAGGVRLDCETPMQRWAVRFSGRLEQQGYVEGSSPLRVVEPTRAQVRASVDLTFVAQAPPHAPGTDDDPELLARRLGEATWDARLLRAARRARPRGYVQQGQLQGTVAIGDVLVPVRAWSLRQHHWGVRDWGACTRAFQSMWAVADDCRGWVHHARFPFVTIEGGFWSQRDRVAPVRSLHTVVAERSGRAPARVGLTLSEAEGSYRLQAEACSELSFVVDGRGRVDLALLRFDGPRPGWGLWTGLQRVLAAP
ncbi:MAG: hypothetical protein AB1Z98_38995 [Nannocystaceae bacterium]